MKRSTSAPSSSRKYSAIVSPDSATRIGLRAGSFILAEHEHRVLEDARLLHLEPEVVALARALADAAERRQARGLLGDLRMELLDENGLADAGAAEQADLATRRRCASRSTTLMRSRASRA